MTDAALSVGRGISSLIRVPEKVKKKKTVSSIAAWRPEKKKKKTYLFRPRQIFPEGFPKRNNRDFHAENMKFIHDQNYSGINGFPDRPARVDMNPLLPEVILSPNYHTRRFVRCIDRCREESDRFIKRWKQRADDEGCVQEMNLNRYAPHFRDVYNPILDPNRPANIRKRPNEKKRSELRSSPPKHCAGLFSDTLRNRCAI